MKKLLRSAALLAAFALVFTACNPAGQTYDKNGLSFDYPAGWTITTDDYADSRGYLTIEKDGATPKADIIIGWLEIDANIGADMMLATIFNEMQTTDRLADFKADDAIDTTYGSYPARAISYTATVDGAPVSGAVWVFKAEGHVVNVAIREGAAKTNVADFKIIKDSFKLTPKP